MPCKLQLSVNQSDCDHLVSVLGSLTPNGSVHFPVQGPPVGSPHHLDNEREIISEPFVAFQSLEFMLLPDQEDPVVAVTTEFSVLITFNHEGQKQFNQAVTKIKRHAYYRDVATQARVSFDQENQPDSGIIFWAGYFSQIVYC